MKNLLIPLAAWFAERLRDAKAPQRYAWVTGSEA